MFEDILVPVIAVIVLIVLGLIAWYLTTLRTTVPANEAHVVMGSTAAKKAMRIKTREVKREVKDPAGNPVKNDKGEIVYEMVTEQVVDANGNPVWETIGMLVYSNDPNQSPDGITKTQYYRIPSWVPRVGITVKKINMEIKHIEIPNKVTFTSSNAQVSVDSDIYYRIVDVVTAARRIASIEQLEKDIDALLEGVIRKVTAQFAVADLIKERQKLADELKKDISDDGKKWGIEITTVVVRTIKDPIKLKADGKTPETDPQTGEPILLSTVIRDTVKPKEAEIAKNARMQVATNMRDAQITEAQARQDAETAKILADQNIRMKQQAADQAVAEAQKVAVEKALAVDRTKAETNADIQRNVIKVNADATKNQTIINAEAAQQKKVIEADAEAQAAVKIAEGNAKAKIAEQDGLGQGTAKLAAGQKLATIAEAEAAQQKQVLEATGKADAIKVVAEATKQQSTLEGQGEAEKTRAVGLAKGDAIRAEKIGEADGLAKIAEAQTKLQAGAERIRTIEKEEKIGVAQAEALQHADIKIYSSTAQGAMGGLKGILSDPIQAAKAGAAAGNVVQGLNDTSPVTLGMVKKLVGGVGKKYGIDLNLDDVVKEACAEEDHKDGKDAA